MFRDRWTGITLGMAVDQASELYGGREAFVFADKRISFHDLRIEANRVARAFLKLGLQPGDRVGIWMAGHSEWPPLFFGLAKAGLVLVPLNSRYKPNELEYALRKSRISALVFKNETVKDKDYKAILSEVCKGSDSDRSAGFKNTKFPDLRWIIAVTEKPVPGLLSFASLIRETTSDDDALVERAEKRIQSTDVALIQFTSGTTALPKGAELYHEAMLRAGFYRCSCLRLTPEDRFFSPLPFYHVGGSIHVMLAPIVSGCTVVVQQYFDSTEALRLMELERCTVTIGHQPHWIEYLRHPDLGKRRLTLRTALVGATNPEVRRMVEEKLGLKSMLGFSQTETHLGGSMSSLDDPPDARIGTSGRAMPGVEIEIHDTNTGASLAPGQVGEICMRGWCVMNGYFDDPQKTKETIDAAGWLHTGDLGILNEEGRLVHKGRTKDTIRVGGEQLSASEVEEWLLSHPDVKEAAVVGKPEARLGEVCVAFVELAGSAKVTEAELQDFCRKGLASFKVPRQIYFVSDWPMSSSGKIQKTVLQERFHS